MVLIFIIAFIFFIVFIVKVLDRLKMIAEFQKEIATSQKELVYILRNNKPQE